MGYGCASLDNIAASGRVAIAKYDGRARFLSSEDYARECAGLAFRAFVHGTVSVELSYDYEIGAAVIDSADYGNGVIEHFSVTRVPDIGKNGESVADKLNAYVRERCNGSKIIENCEYASVEDGGVLLRSPDGTLFADLEIFSY